MAVNYFKFNGTDSRTYGVYISGSGVFGAPERDVTKVSIPGRNGEIVLDNGRYKNIEVKYPAFIKDDFVDNISDFRNWVLGVTGYARLEDSYHTDEFRLARFKGALKTKPVLKALTNGVFDIVFDCKPQRFLKTGTIAQTFTEDGTITNPTGMTALPYISITGTGTLTIGDISLEVTESDGIIYVDCETQEAYSTSGNRNSYIEVEDGEFPVLEPGENEITLDGITRVSIAPRWWIL